jgi:hypothetical protein
MIMRTIMRSVVGNCEIALIGDGYTGRIHLNTIVWVMGESASGKATFMKYAVTNPNCELMHQLGFNNHKIILIEESKYLGEYKRMIIKDLILNLLEKESNAVVMIKWQATDSLHQKYGELLRNLTLATPDSSHEIILLSVESDALYTRLQKKPWWNDPDDPYAYYSHEQMNQNVERLRRHVLDLTRLGFTLKEIDSTNGYRIIEAQ